MLINIGRFSNNSEGSKNVTIKMNSLFFHTFSAFIRTHFKNGKCNVNFLGVEFLRTAPKFGNRKRNSLCCVYVIQTISHK